MTKIIEKESVSKSELIEETLYFWFKGNPHIRSPFPNYIQTELKEIAISKFEVWLNQLHQDAHKEVNDEILAEKFEEILFESAVPLVLTEDERITILYPFLPRLDDEVLNQNQEKSTVVDRMIKQEGDLSFLKVTCKNLSDGEKWNTSFELPK